MKKSLKIWIAVFFCAVFAVLCMFAYRYAVDKYERRSYPLPDEYIECIKNNSIEYDVPIEYICGVIRSESSFNPSVVSHAGAVGMMQITKDTFVWLQSKRGEEYGEDKLYDYEINIEYGTYYLSRLYDEFGDWKTVFAAYNAGPNRVKQWLDDDRYSSDGVLTSIPFGETEKYVANVFKSAEYYARLYFSE